jgi:hypothetical protein
MKELDTTSNLLQDTECEVAVLQDKVRIMEDEASRQKGEIDVSVRGRARAVHEHTGVGDELVQSTSTPPGRRPARTPTARSRMTSHTSSGLTTMVKTTEAVATAVGESMRLMPQR